MKKFKFTINGNQYEAEIISVDDNLATLEINGTAYSVEVERKLTTSKTPKLVRSAVDSSANLHASVPKTNSPDAPKGSGTIKSPLPGVILDVFVREGDTVKVGQKLLMLEAMKMENIIESDKDGRIASIKKNKGDQTMEGEVLIVIGE
ncbi:MAG: biotin/lipoyl-binding protein [Bacteroidetes bacterium]|nr:biotin/lipoyl-binding protein [Bacteroidales bacterium]MBU1008643.1 biotin/lipoyl-binding protein [Bacteroidota bacterium]